MCAGSVKAEVGGGGHLFQYQVHVRHTVGATRYNGAVSWGR